MKIILTGGSGFLGKRIEGILRAQGHTLFIPRKSDCDLRIQEDVTRYFSNASKSGPIDSVIHAAATVSGIGAIWKRPATFFYDNAMMGMNVVHTSYIHGVKNVTFIGSACEYPGDSPPDVEENFLWHGYPERTNAPYGISKRMVGEMMSAYYEEGKIRGSHLILANLYGPGDNFDPSTSHVIPALIRKYHEAVQGDHKTVTLWGTGTPTRSFLFVRDAALAIIEAMYEISSPAPINIAPREKISIKALSELIAEELGFEGKTIFDSSYPDGQMERSFSTKLADELLKWRPTTSFEEGLRHTINWWKLSL